MINPFEQPFEFKVAKFEEKFDEFGLTVEGKGELPIITLNTNQAYRILANRKVIIAGLNKKLDELVETKIGQLAEDEIELEKGK